MSLKSVFFLFAGAAMLPAVAFAADYEPPVFVEEAEEYVPVEVGSGWYLRGDIGYMFDRNFKDQVLAVDDTLFDNNLVGLGWVGPLDLIGVSQRRYPITGSVGFGYHFNDYLRGDFTVGILTNDKYSAAGNLAAGFFTPPSTIDWFDPTVTDLPDFGCLGTRTVTTTTLDADGNPVGAPVVTVDDDWRRNCAVAASARTTAWNGMANGYIDLGTYVGITPYVGAGLGLLYTRTTVSAAADCRNGSVTQSDGTTSTTSVFNCRNGEGSREFARYDETKYNLMYGLSAGFAYKVSNNTSIDVGYQYLSAPSLDYYTVSDDGIRHRKGFDSHQIKVGFRYDLW